MSNLAQSTRIADNFYVWSGRANPEVVQLIGQLFADEGEQRSKELLHWQYLDHLSGAEVCIAHTAAGLFEEPAALYAAFPTRFRIAGRDETCFQSFDTLTVKRFRGRGLFTQLAELLYGRLAASGAPLVYGIPNAESFGGFTRKLHWTSLDPLPMMVRPIGLRYPRVRARIRRPRIQAAAIEPAIHVREVTTCSIEVSELIARSNYHGKNGVIRDSDFLKWRLGRPGNSYRVLESRDDTGRLTGVLVFTLLSKHGCSVGYIMEHIIDLSHIHHGDELASAATSCLKASGADLVLAWALPDNVSYPCLRRQGFISLSNKVSPVELHLGYRLLDSGIGDLKRSDFAFSYLDSDTV